MKKRFIFATKPQAQEMRMKTSFLRRKRIVVRFLARELRLSSGVTLEVD